MAGHIAIPSSSMDEGRGSAALLRCLGRQAEAAPIMRQLAAIGYCHPEFKGV